jgi:hypothetical protein
LEIQPAANRQVDKRILINKTPTVKAIVGVLYLQLITGTPPGVTKPGNSHYEFF